MKEIGLNSRNSKYVIWTTSIFFYSVMNSFFLSKWKPVLTLKDAKENQAAWNAEV